MLGQTDGHLYRFIDPARHAGSGSVNNVALQLYCSLIVGHAQIAQCMRFDAFDYVAIITRVYYYYLIITSVNSVLGPFCRLPAASPGGG